MTQSKKVGYVYKVAETLHKRVPASQNPLFSHNGTQGDHRPIKKLPNVQVGESPLSKKKSGLGDLTPA
jgi:hypothetical protein